MSGSMSFAGPPRPEHSLAFGRHPAGGILRFRRTLTVDGGQARAFTRNGFDWTSSYVPIVEAAEELRCRSATSGVALRWRCLPARTSKGCATLAAPSLPSRPLTGRPYASAWPGWALIGPPIPALRKRGAQWVRPELVVGVRHLRGSGPLRHPTVQSVE